MTTSSILAEKAMIATLETSCWTGRKTDKEATKELLEEKKADQNAGNFSKALIPKEAIKDIRSIISEARSFHKEITMPWNKNGGGLLPSTKYSMHTAKMRELQDKLEKAVEDFINMYNNLINDSSHRLGDLFNVDEYPNKDDLTEKFSIDVKYEKVPEADDFRLNISKEEQDKLKQHVTEQVEKQHAEAMARMWRRIFTVVENMHDTLKDKDKIFRDSMIEKIENLVGLLPELNVTNDPKLTELTNDLKDQLCGYNPDDLRKDEKTREEAAERSGKIMTKINEMASLFAA